MTTANGIIAHLVVGDGLGAIDFYKRALDAEVVFELKAPGTEKILHSQLTVNGASFYLNDDFPEFGDGKSRTPSALGGTPVNLHLQVPDCDAAVAKAEAAGGTVIMPAEDMFWGDRYAKVRDPFGHEWSFATVVKSLTPEEMEEATIEAFSEFGS